MKCLCKNFCKNRKASKSCKKNLTEKGFKGVLSDKRIPVPAPHSIIDSEGKAVFGTFDREIPDMNFLDVHKQSPVFPDFMNKSRLTLWEACELNFDDIVVLVAVADMGGVFGTTLTVLYDKKEKKRYTWQSTLPIWKTKIAENLLDGAVTVGKSHINRVEFVNDFGNGKATVTCKARGKAGKFELEGNLTRVSEPSVVNIPFGKNKPLYTQKDLFKLDGYVKWNGKTYKSTDCSTAIIDDHRGYYPYNSHYDWVTTMGRQEINGKEQFFGINLTRNQSINQDDYNENLLWLEGTSSRLTPVYFDHVAYDKWHVYDDYGMVDLIFDIGDRNLIKMNILGIVKSDYHITFGVINGYVCDEDGNKVVFDNAVGIGEDKSLRV